MAPARLLARPIGLRADSARNRAHLLDCARTMLAADPASPSLNSLAQAAGVGVGTVYRHFPNTRILLESVAVDSFADLLERVRVLSDEPNSSVAFEQMIRTTFDRQAHDPGLAAALALPTFQCADMHDLAAEFSGVVGAIITRARAAGALRDDVTPDDIRRLLNGLRIATRKLSPAKSSQYVDVLLAGLRAAT
jgi:AcrR family transcriptional regulator